MESLGFYLFRPKRIKRTRAVAMIKSAAPTQLASITKRKFESANRCATVLADAKLNLRRVACIKTGEGLTGCNVEANFCSRGARFF